MTTESAAALQQLRKAGAFDWSIIAQLSFVLYAYASAVRRGALRAVALGLGFWGLEFVWEMFNALVLHVSQHAPLWSVTGKSVFVLYVGLNLEISLMFAVLPLVLFQLLPEDPLQTILGLPSRVFIPIAVGIFCVTIEVLLNRAGVLHWSWPFWRWPHVWLIVVAYCAPCVALVWLHDHLSLRQSVRVMILAIAVAVSCHLMFSYTLGWI